MPLMLLLIFPFDFVVLWRKKGIGSLLDLLVRFSFMDQCVGSSFSRPLDLRQSWDAYSLVTLNWNGLDLSIP
jgi:hypothetical protein